MPRIRGKRPFKRNFSMIIAAVLMIAAFPCLLYAAETPNAGDFTATLSPLSQSFLITSGILLSVILQNRIAAVLCGGNSCGLNNAILRPDRIMIRYYICRVSLCRV